MINVITCGDYIYIYVFVCARSRIFVCVCVYKSSVKICAFLCLYLWTLKFAIFNKVISMMKLGKLHHLKIVVTKCVNFLKYAILIDCTIDKINNKITIKSRRFPRIIKYCLIKNRLHVWLL